ncbi:MAG: hypothetical protein H7840_15085 [Alphaproteobacteria bacterium]
MFRTHSLRQPICGRLLARDAATGSLAVRGSSDHEAASFIVRSCFLLGSILIPPLSPQDRSRFVVCELDQLTGDRPKGLNERHLTDLGALCLLDILSAAESLTFRTRIDQGMHRRFAPSRSLIQRALSPDAALSAERYAVR